MQIKDHAAIVTGGGSGLGAATARALAGAGARVAVFDINEKAAAAVAGEIGGIAVACNVADAASAEAAIGKARAAHGAARILINCAGIGPAARIVGRDGPMALDAFRQVIEVNLIGSFNLAAYEGQIGQAAYSASKGGIVALTMPAAREFARSGIRVNTIAPGLFATPLLLGMPQPVQDSLAASVPFPSRFGTPQEYAKLALHIIDNAMLNGETIRLDGALRMPPK